MRKQNSFNGFSKETLKFFQDIEANNNKPWFEKRKGVFNDIVVEPLRHLVMDLSEFMLDIDSKIETRPAVNKTISRIYRDTRFSKDKSPYKSVMWMTFRRPGKEWQEAPAYFFEITAASYRYGMGFYCASKATMDRFRARLDQRPQEFLKTVAPLKQEKIYTLAGEKYKRIIDASKTPEIQEWYQRKNFYLACNKNPDKSLLSSRLVDDLKHAYGLAAPLYHYLWELK